MKSAGGWTIGDRLSEDGGVGTVAPAGDLWPHQVLSFKYLDFTTGVWESDPQLTVTGNININILYLNIDV